MTRIAALALAVLMGGLAPPLSGQASSSLRLEVTMTGPDGRPAPVARFALQITDNPASAPPRRTVTRADGTVDVRVAPGHYTVESVEPLVMGAARYQWAVSVEVAAGARVVVTMSEVNAERLDGDETSPGPDGRVARASVLARWQHSVVELWSPTAHGAGVVVGPGVVATDRTVVGSATRVEVQFDAARKVEGGVVAQDPSSGLALVRVNDDAMREAGRVAVPCEVAPSAPTVSDEIAALVPPIGAALRVTIGYVDDVAPEAVASDLDAQDDARGAPVFNAALQWIGVAVTTPPGGEARTDHLRVMPASRVCAALQAHAASVSAAVPSPVRLPVEPVATSRSDDSAAPPQTLSLAALPRMTSDDFDITFLVSSRVVIDRGRRGSDEPWQQLVTEFANWTEYVERRFPVVYVRVTPRLTEGFWGKVARGAALTQGVSLPPLKRMKPNFAHLRVTCGATEIVPIHPFVLEHDLSETDRLVEGFSVFDPSAWTGACSDVRLHLSSVAAPSRVDVVTVPPQVLAQLRKDLS